MSVAGVTVSTTDVLAVVAAVIGLGCLVLGRHGASRTVLMVIAGTVALSGVLIGVRLVDVQPTHALLSDSESTAPQSAAAPSHGPESLGDAEQNARPAGPSDGTDTGQPGDGEDPGPGAAGTPQAQPDPPAPTEQPADTSPQPAPPLPQESPATEAPADTGDQG